MKLLILACGALFAASAANAATLYTLTGPTAETGSPGSIGAAFTAGAGAGSATFQINGYRTLDGINAGPLADTFTLSVNGTAVYSAQFDLGGFGSPVNVLLAPAGATQSAINNGFGQGGTAQVSVPISLLAGSNTLTFAYAGADQGLGDEAWGLSNVLVTGNAPAVGGVPEPATWAMLIGGFGLVGASARRRRAAVVTA
ncbi:PEPxxWA-CTERM sorting domain-containing protein [Glacieibacterium frigidum]|nr:PEPxxWA-CTERM sorting domain-containing protein [Glacieibacterium frigidum]